MNTDNCIEVIKPGLYTTIQDRGRYAYRHWGVPVGGAMDQHSFRFVNACLGNIPYEAVIEVTMIGPELFFHGSALICISGADAQIFLDNEIVPMNQVLLVRSGQTLKYGRFLNGCRSYIAIMGGFDIAPVLGSLSPMEDTHLRPFQKADRLPLKLHQETDKDFSLLDFKLHHGVQPMNIDSSTAIRVSYGPEWGWLSVDSHTLLSEAAFTISAHADRMGYRLKGPDLERDHTEELLSSAVMPGTVQLLPDGQLVILMRSCQTTGGYPRILQADEESINILAQRRPGEQVKFLVDSVQ